MISAEFNFNTVKQFISENNKVPLALTTLFALFLLLSIIGTITRFHLPASTQTLTAPTISAPTTRSGDIANFHLFGQYQDNINLLPQTTLQLTLEGIALAVTPDEKSRAIISSNGSSKIYTVGQEVPGGATIKAINRTQVILEQNRQLTSLKLPIPKLDLQNGLYQNTSVS